jgi:flagellar hook assembly protein FlgD
MMQFYPSPFMRFGTGVSTVTFPAEQGGEFILRIYDSSGRQIRKIVYYAHTSGNHSIFWNGRSDDGTLVSSGAYTLSLHSFHQSFKTNAILVF